MPSRLRLLLCATAIQHRLLAADFIFAEGRRLGACECHFASLLIGNSSAYGCQSLLHKKLLITYRSVHWVGNNHELFMVADKEPHDKRSQKKKPDRPGVR